MMKPCRTNKYFNYSALHLCVFIFFLSIIMFLPFVIMDKGIFTYYSDFNAQQIPFYMMVHDAICSGEIGWNWYTDLGSSLVGSYSFYLLGSPFFWLTIPFPSNWVPYLMAPLLCLKYMIMGFGAYIYLKRFVSNEFAFIGSLLYVFSGFSIYNLSYNHFYEPMIYLPFLLWTMERRMKDEKCGYFAFFVFLSAVGNYYFFVGQCVFLFVYWLVRLFSNGWEIKKRNIIGIIVEAFLGIGGAACLLIPSIMMLLGNDRASSFLSGSDLFIYNDKGVYLSYFCSFLFPPDLVGDSKLFELENGWSTPTNWIPLFGCLGALAYFLYNGWKDWLKKLIVLFFIVGWVPFLNASFSLFNANYYSRWCYMLTILLILATVILLEKEDDKCRQCWNKAFIIISSLTGIMVLLFFVLPAKNAFDIFDTIAFKNPLRVFAIVFFTIVSLFSAIKILKERNQNKKQFIQYIITFVCVISMLFNCYMIRLGREITDLFNNKKDFIIEKAINGNNGIESTCDKDSFYRIDDANGIINLGMYWEIPSLQSYNSTVEPSIIEFYKSLGVERIVRSEVDAGHYPLRSFLSVKKAYDYFAYYHDSDKGCRIDGWKQVGEDNGFQVYKNTNFVNMGFSYNEYITCSEYESLPYDKREKALLKFLIVSDDVKQNISTLLEHGNLQVENYSYEAFVDDCKERENSVSRDFVIIKSGFQSNVFSDKDNYVLYSVPYDNGWSATVNGKPVEIIQSNVGFMSVLCKKGNNEVVFTYSTPGLKSGFFVSIISALLLVLWLCFEDRLLKKKEFEGEPNE